MLPHHLVKKKHSQQVGALARQSTPTVRVLHFDLRTLFDAFLLLPVEMKQLLLEIGRLWKTKALRLGNAQVLLRAARQRNQAQDQNENRRETSSCRLDLIHQAFPFESQIRD